jgi:ABC-type antimicrobial peptide transport system permease subunit
MLRSFTDIKPMITWGVVALSILTCVVVGTVFGILPAARASKKDTVECLRTE